MDTPQNPEPGAPEPEPSDRRGFIGMLTGGLGGLIALVAAAPPLSLILHPLLANKGSSDETWLTAGPLARFQTGGPPVPVPIQLERQDAWQKLPAASVGFAFVQRISETELRVLSGVCPHMGCAVSVKGAGFVCPCHRSRFEISGDVAAPEEGKTNPSPRGLDPLPYRVQDGQVEIQWVRYESGTQDRIERG